MINANMRYYHYSTLGSNNAYGVPQESDIKGFIKMAINITSQSVQDNIKYKDCSYVGLTMADVSDDFIIHYGAEKLKVLYVNPMGRYKQVFMKEML